jgi:hypothetical protein
MNRVIVSISKRCCEYASMNCSRAFRKLHHVAEPNQAASIEHKPAAKLAVAATMYQRYCLHKMAVKSVSAQ